MTPKEKCDYPNCEKVKSLVKHKENLIKENEELRKMLIEAGLIKQAIKIDYSHNAQHYDPERKSR